MQIQQHLSVECVQMVVQRVLVLFGFNAILAHQGSSYLILNAKQVVLMDFGPIVQVTNVLIVILHVVNVLDQAIINA